LVTQSTVEYREVTTQPSGECPRACRPVAHARVPFSGLRAEPVRLWRRDVALSGVRRPEWLSRRRGAVRGHALAGRRDVSDRPAHGSRRSDVDRAGFPDREGSAGPGVA